MQWQEVLSLHELLDFLARNLQTDVEDIVMRLCETKSTLGETVLVFQEKEYSSIIGRDGQSAYEKVEELVWQLVISCARPSTGMPVAHGSGSYGRSAFSALCDVCRDIQRGDVADALEAKSRDLLLQPMSSQLAAQCRSLLTDQSKWGCTNTAGRSARLRAQRVDRFAKHLRTLSAVECRGRRQETCDLALGLPHAVQDVFVSMQMISERQALRFASAPSAGSGRGSGHAAYGSRRREGALVGGEDLDRRCTLGTFSFHCPSQLLMPDPRVLQPVVGWKSNSAAESELQMLECGSTDASRALVHKKCLVISGAGKGKTVLCQRVLADFACPESNTTMRRTFEFIIHVPCRDLRRSTTDDWIVLLGLDAPALGFEDCERRMVLDHLCDNSERVLVVIDGVDEVGKDGFPRTSAILSLLEGSSASLLLAASMIVTSRPCQQAHDLVGDCDVRYRLRGFSQDQLEKVLCNNLGPADGTRCLEDLRFSSRCHLMEAVRSTPLLATLLCSQYARMASIPSCVSLFYAEFVRAALQRWELKHSRILGMLRTCHEVRSSAYGGLVLKAGGAISIFDVIKHHLESSVEASDDTAASSTSADIVKALLVLYDLSLHGLLSGQFSFLLSDFPSAEYRDILLELGVLVYSSPGAASIGEPCKNVALLHLTLQEWCAARAVTLSAECADRTRHCAEAFGVGEQSWPFWQFLCGSLPSDMLRDVFLVMEHNFDGLDRHHKNLKAFQLRCLTENWFARGGGSGGAAAGSCCEPIPSQHDTAYVAAATHLCREGVDLRNIPLDGADVLAIKHAASWADCLDSAVLDLYNCGLTSDQIRMLVPVLVKFQKVDLSRNTLSVDWLDQLYATALRDTETCLRELLIYKGTTTEDIGIVSTSLANCVRIPKLSKFHLWGNHSLGSEGLPVFSRCLARTTIRLSLTYLSLSDCNLGQGCGEDIASIVGRLPVLQVLELESNRLGNSDACMLLSTLCGNFHIKRVNLCENCLDNDVAAALDSFLKYRAGSVQTETEAGPEGPCILLLTGNVVTPSLLHSLAVSGAGHRDDDEVWISSLYLRSTAIERRSIELLVGEHGGTGLDWLVPTELMPSLSEYMATAPSSQLIHLSLRCNQIDDDGAAKLARGLARNSTLQTLDLSKNQIKLPGVVDLLTSVADRSSGVRALHLWWNPIFHAYSNPEDSVFQTFLCQLSANELVFLSLQKSGMTDAIGVQVLAALKCHPHLALVSLSDNQLSDESARKLCEIKKVNKYLKYVSFRNNGITDGGLRSMMQSEKVMAMENIWLYGNQCSPELLCYPMSDEEFFYNSMKEMMEYIAIDLAA